jgi:hypothetical protein
LGGDYIANLFMAALLFHGCIGAIWLLRHPSERLRAILIHASQNRKELRPRLANLILGGLVALAICLPWYLRNGAFALKSTVFTATQDAALRGLPPITSPAACCNICSFWRTTSCTWHSSFCFTWGCYCLASKSEKDCSRSSSAWRPPIWQ